MLTEQDNVMIFHIKYVAIKHFIILQLGNRFYNFKEHNYNTKTKTKKPTRNWSSPKLNIFYDTVFLKNCLQINNSYSHQVLNMLHTFNHINTYKSGSAEWFIDMFVSVYNTNLKNLQKIVVFHVLGHKLSQVW